MKDWFLNSFFQCEERGHDCSDTTCVNYTSKTECTASRCGADCKNQRFQKKEWIEISLVKRGRMGYGARTEQDVQKGQFVMEYVGEGMCLFVLFCFVLFFLVLDFSPHPLSSSD